MSFIKDMKFCWRRFRHFVAAYAAIGLAATATHGLIFSPAFRLALEEETPTAVAEAPAAPAEVSAETPVENVDAAPVPAESDAAGATDTSGGAQITDDSTDAIAAPTDAVDGSAPAPDQTTDNVVTDEPDPAATTTDAVTDTSADAVVAPDETADQTVPVQDDVPSADSTASDTTADSSDTTDDRANADVPVEVPTTDETPVDVPADTSTQTTDAQVAIPDSWPEERLTPEELVAEPVIEEPPVSPYADVRGTLEAVAPQLDWLYTLRAGAAYDNINTSRTAASMQMSELIQLLEAGASDSSINDHFCSIDTNLQKLRTDLAPGSDDTQPTVDAGNTAVLDELDSTMTDIRNLWLHTSGATWQCAR